MTIASELAFLQLPCNGVTTQFSYGNKIFTAADLVVTLIDTLGMQYSFLPSGFNTFTNSATGLSYTVSNVDVDTGCSITFTAAPTSGWTIDLRTSIAELQTTSIKNQGAFLPELHEEFFDKAVRLIQDLERLTYTFGIHGPDIENTPWPALPNATIRANTGLVFNSSGLPALGVIPSTVLTQPLFNTFLAASPPYIQTPAEFAAGVVPVNLTIPSHVQLGGVFIVERYGNNTTPGITDMSGVFTTAVKVAQRVGGIITYGGNGQLMLLNPVNAGFGTNGNQHGLVVQGPDATLDTVPLLIAKHNGNAVFNCIGNDSITFRDVSIGTDQVTFPKTAILFARNSSGGGSVTRCFNVRLFGYFSQVPIYNYGAENSVVAFCYLNNRATNAGTRCLQYTGNNAAGLASDFATDNFGNALAIAVGTQSCTQHLALGNVYINQGGTATSDCIEVEQTDLLDVVDGFIANGSATTAGRSAVFANMTNAASNHIHLDGLDNDNQPHNPNYFVAFSNNAFTPSGWSIKRCRNVTNTNFLAALGAAPTLDSFVIEHNQELVTRGISIPGTLQNSSVFTYAQLTIGTSTNNDLTGDATSWTITTTNGGSKKHIAAALTFVPGIVTGVNGWTLVGALTQRARYTYLGNMVHFSILLQAATTLSTAANATIPTLPVPSLVVDDYSCDVRDVTGHTVLGSGKISGSTITLGAIGATGNEILISGSYFVS